MHRFLEIYKDEAERFDTVLMDTNEELEQVRTRIETLEKEIHDIELKQDEHLARELSVLVEPRETGQVEMLVSYVVGRCGWKPAYDIRIFNNDGTMKASSPIVYYGMVQQATGEDWETRYMTLSTAQPGIGGTVPHLGVQRVHFRRDHSPAIPIPRNAISGSGATASGITGGASSTHSGPGASMSGGTSAAGKHSRSCAKLGAFRRSNRPTGTSLNETDRGSVENERVCICVHVNKSSESSRPYQSTERSNLNETSSQLPSAGTIPRYSQRVSANAAVFYQTPPLRRSDMLQGLTDTVAYESDRLAIAYDNSTEQYSTLGRSDSMASSTLTSSIGRRNKIYPRSKSRETLRPSSQVCIASALLHYK
ncbi:unnamed protein product [Trichobilharzia regenti]|nr:unnamed protein product [Trichobilharzia regenti]